MSEFNVSSRLLSRAFILVEAPVRTCVGVVSTPFPKKKPRNPAVKGVSAPLGANVAIPVDPDIVRAPLNSPSPTGMCTRQATPGPCSARIIHCLLGANSVSFAILSACGRNIHAFRKKRRECLRSSRRHLYARGCSSSYCNRSKKPASAWRFSDNASAFSDLSDRFSAVNSKEPPLSAGGVFTRQRGL